MTARIVTLTMNPALDIACVAPAVKPIHKIRTTGEKLDAGGGGINVAKVVHSLGGSTLALVMTGGSPGRICEELLDEAGVPWQSLPVRGRTRISFNVQEHATGLEYRFVPEGPLIARDEWEHALQRVRDEDGAWVVASGSLPRGVPEDFYAQVAAAVEATGRAFALDTSGPALNAVVNSRISLLKLSLGELESLAGTFLRDRVSQEAAAKVLLQSGRIGMVAISLGADGAFLAHRDWLVRLPAIPAEVLGAAGAGDSFLAALVLSLLRGAAPRRALGFAIAAGAAAVSSFGTAHVSRSVVERLYEAHFPDADV